MTHFTTGPWRFHKHRPQMNTDGATHIRVYRCSSVVSLAFLRGLCASAVKEVVTHLNALPGGYGNSTTLRESSPLSANASPSANWLNGNLCVTKASPSTEPSCKKRMALG